MFWQEDTGDETGRWLVQPFEGGETVPFLDGLPVGWNEGLAQAQGLVLAGISTPARSLRGLRVRAGDARRA